jgi:hypothetical protein
MDADAMLNIPIEELGGGLYFFSVRDNQKTLLQGRFVKLATF